jgi:GxxExxY protein
MNEEEIIKQILNASFAVHSALGPGLLENAYERCLFYELGLKKMFVEKQKVLPVVYKEVLLETGYRIDLVVEKKVIVEIKSVEALSNIHISQILTYMKLAECKYGLLINFNVPHLKNGLRRMIR